MAVRRYLPNRDGGMCETDIGPWVRIEDYEYLLAKIALFEAGERARQVEEIRRAIERATSVEQRSND